MNIEAWGKLNVSIPAARERWVGLVRDMGKCLYALSVLQKKKKGYCGEEEARKRETEKERLRNGRVEESVTSWPTIKRSACAGRVDACV